tara:strand:- start:588 stop:782 length:195 start_codon:yes stop_codon:yes gene_type:complete
MILTNIKDWMVWLNPLKSEDGTVIIYSDSPMYEHVHFILAVIIHLSIYAAVFFPDALRGNKLNL